MKYALLLSCSLLALAGCSSSKKVIIAPPTGESGYASAGIDLDTIGEVVSASARLQVGDFSGPPSVGLTTVNLTFEDTGPGGGGGPNEFTAVFDGVAVPLAWDAADSRFEGTFNSVEIWASPMFLSTNNQLSFVWLNIMDGRGGGNFQHWGPGLVGFNTDPVAVDARSGMATYLGTSNISINAVDDSFWTSANGPADISVNFDTGSLSGTLDLTDCGCGFGGAAISPTTISLSNGTISGNTFSADVTLNLADLQMTSFDTLTASGQFYETNATGVGGTFDGSGVSTIGGQAITMTGGFAGDE